MSGSNNNKLVFVAPSPIHGRGLFATRPMAPGQLIGVYNGLEVTEDDVYVRGRVTYLRNISPGDAPYSETLGQVEYVSDNNITREEYYAWGQPVFTDARTSHVY